MKDTHPILNLDALALPLSAGWEITRGRYEAVPIETYHAHSSINNSSIGLVLRSPAHFKAARDYPPEPSRAMIYGNAIHTAVLQPELLLETYRPPAPSCPKGRTKAEKSAYQDWLDTGELDEYQLQYPTSAQQLTQSEWDRLDPMVARLREEPEADFLLGLGAPESTFVSKDPISGLWRRCRPDVTGEARNLLVDLKSTRDARPLPFSRTIFDYGYYRQAAFYLDTVNEALGEQVVTGFAFVAIEKEPPYGVGTFVLDQADIERGREENHRALAKLAWCVDNDTWPGYANRIQAIGMQRYHRRQLDQGDPTK